MSKKVFELRNRLGLTQEALAQKLDVSRNYVYMIENGRPPGKKFVEKVRELERSSESRETVVREDPYPTGENATAARLRLDAQTLRVMANRLDAEAREIETRHSR